MDDEIKTGEMTSEIDESIVVEEDFTLLEGKAVSINDDSDNKTNEEEVYEEALGIKESLDDIRDQIKDKLLDILEKGKITDADGCEIELLNDQYTEKYNALKDLANTVIPGGGGTARNLDPSTTEKIETTIDYDEIMKTLSEHDEMFYTDEEGNLLINGMSIPTLTMVINKLNLIASGGEDGYSSLSLTPEFIEMVVQQVENESVKDVLTKYYLSTSTTELIGGEWLDTLPSAAEQAGKYLWYKIVTTYNNPNKEPTETGPVCISSEPGTDGVDGYTIITTSDTIIFREV